MGPPVGGTAPQHPETSSSGTRETLLDTLSEEKRSPLDKYRELHVGGGSFLDFVRYELLTFFLSWVPGAAGYLLRKTLYRGLFASVGRGAVLGPHVTLRCPRRISLGDDAFVDGNAVLDAKGAGSRIRLGDSVLIGRNTILSCASGSIELGADVSIGPNCTVRAGLGDVRLGSHITIGANSVIISGNPGYDRTDVPMKQQVGSGRGVVIGDDVWIGVGVRIVDGVRVGDGCVLGAGAVVIDSVPAGSIAAGVPARVIGHRAPRKEG